MKAREAKRERMRKLVREWLASGEPASRFAAQQGLTKETFRFWRQRFGRNKARRGRRRPAEPVLAAVRVVDDLGAAGFATVEIRLVGGDVIRAGDGLTLDRLAGIVRVLRERC